MKPVQKENGDHQIPRPQFHRQINQSNFFKHKIPSPSLSLSLSLCMGFSFFSFSCATTLLLSFAPRASSGLINIHSIHPNFNASYFKFIDQSGVFLISSNGTFQALISKPIPEIQQFYFSIVHAQSNTVIWTANRNRSISDSALLQLTINGLVITDEFGGVVWSTPKLSSPVSVLQLLDSGNLVLLDKRNVSLWNSFDYPTNTFVMGQRLRVGKSLDGDEAKGNFSAGDYRFIVTASDAVLQWNGMSYWKLSMDRMAYMDSDTTVSFLEMNSTGMYLLGKDDGSMIVIRLALGESDFRIAKLEHNGSFSVSSFVNSKWVSDFVSPTEDCQIPFVCGKLKLCSTRNCICPPGFRIETNGDYCVPKNNSLSLPSPCSVSGNDGELNSSVSYLKLGNGVDYFANDFTDPVKHGVSLLDCEGLCSRNCSCLGVFHENASGSCYLLEHRLGSFKPSSIEEEDRLGYIKTLVGSSPEDPGTEILAEDNKLNFPIAGLVLLPSSGVFLLIIIVVGFLWWRRAWIFGNAVIKFGSRNSSSSELEIIEIPGLPVRFDYEELAAATGKFMTQIGIGGFGTVYKGTLPDKTIVAVKKITSLGVQGKKEFCTEIAIIGKTHHVNLVSLKGFCVQGRQRYLVYEYMNRGSSDGPLFSNNVPVLEWQERFEIALGTARGLAYLHSGCEHKIIHCDVKPENILLNDSLQVKLSDFGLSKLLGPEQSSQFTTMRGTRGYLAPEWLTSSAISDKTDVYSYGMVLLEIVRGRKNCSLQSPSQEPSRSTENDSSSGGGNGQSSSSSGWKSRAAYFPLLALEMHEQRRYLELADPRLEGRVTGSEVEKLVRVALCCVHEEPMLRPSMANVVGMLEGGVPLGEPRVDSLSFLRFYGRRFTEDSTTGGSNNEQNEFIVNVQENGTSATSGSYNSMSYISSQEVSGPR